LTGLYNLNYKNNVQFILVKGVKKSTILFSILVTIISFGLQSCIVITNKDSSDSNSNSWNFGFNGCQELKDTRGSINTTNLNGLKISGALNTVVKHTPTNCVKWEGRSANGKPPTIQTTNDTLTLISPEGCSDNLNIEVGTTGDFSGIISSGATKLEFTENTLASNLSLDTSGASSVILNEVIKNGYISTSGASKINANNIDQAVVDSSGASRIYFGNSNKIKGTLSGASHIDTSGNTNIDVETSGASSISRH
jgi:hypothetical protein